MNLFFEATSYQGGCPNVRLHMHSYEIITQDASMQEAWLIHHIKAEVVQPYTKRGLNDLKATASACPRLLPAMKRQTTYSICFVDALEVSPMLSKKTTLKRQAGEFHNQRHKRNDASGREDSSSRVANHSSNSRKKPQLCKSLSKRWICNK